MQFYGHKSDKGFRNVYPNPQSVRMCGNGEVIPLEVTIANVLDTVPDEWRDEKYYGWQETGKDRISLIQRTFLIFHIQFAYGVQEAINRGQGKLVELNIVESTAP